MTVSKGLEEQKRFCVRVRVCGVCMSRASGEDTKARQSPDTLVYV